MAGAAGLLLTGPLTEADGAAAGSVAAGELTAALTAGRVTERDAVGRWTTGRRLGVAGGVELAVFAAEATGGEIAGAAAVGKAIDGAGSEGAASWRPGDVAQAAANPATATATAVAGFHCRQWPHLREPDERNNKMPAISVGAVNKEGDA